VPGDAASFRDSKSAAQHQQEEQAVAHRINDLEKGDEVGLGHRLRQRLRGEQPVAVLDDGLILHLAGFTQECKEALEHAECVIDGAGRQFLLPGGPDVDIEVVRGHASEILPDALAARLR